MFFSIKPDESHATDTSIKTGTRNIRHVLIPVCSIKCLRYWYKPYKATETALIHSTHHSTDILNLHYNISPALFTDPHDT